MRQVAPFKVSYGEFTGHAPTPACALWPVPPTSKPHQVSAPGLPPPLVVSTTHDPATPYQAGVDLAKQPGAMLLTSEGTQHTVVFQGQQVRQHRLGGLPVGQHPAAAGHDLLVDACIRAGILPDHRPDARVKVPLGVRLPRVPVGRLRPACPP